MNNLTDIDWENWRAKDPATLVFVFRDDEVLLINKKRGLGKGKVNGPGGKVDPGETPEQSVADIESLAAVKAARDAGLTVDASQVEVLVLLHEHLGQAERVLDLHVVVYQAVLDLQASLVVVHVVGGT